MLFAMEETDLSDATALATSCYNGILAIVGSLAHSGALDERQVRLIHQAMSRPLEDPAVRDRAGIVYLRDNLDALLSGLLNRR
jgi:hypothetical protein